jgi:hypothetical protein
MTTHKKGEVRYAPLGKLKGKWSLLPAGKTYKTKAQAEKVIANIKKSRKKSGATPLEMQVAKLIKK